MSCRILSFLACDPEQGKQVYKRWNEQTDKGRKAHPFSGSGMD